VTERHVIDTRAEYLEATEALAHGTGPAAVDAERASGYRYSQRAYLIQIYRRDAGIFLFDPPAIGRFDELEAVLAGTEWVLHAASQDLACLREVGLDPHSIFDTELAARLLGFARVGLGAVVEELLGVHLAKEHSAADWSTRPLPEAWLEYAALDVELLVDVRDRLETLLAEQGKTEIAAQEFEAVRMRDVKLPKQEPWRRLSGIHSVRGARNLAIARELWTARDALARERDIAPGRLVPDASIIAAVKAEPKSRAELAALKNFTGRASRSDIATWWRAIELGRATDDLPVPRPPSDALPPPRSWADRNPEADTRLKSARQALAELADAMTMPVENLLTPETLRRLAWAPPEPISVATIGAALADAGARPWQIAATAQPIADAFIDARQRVSEGDEAAS